MQLAHKEIKQPVFVSVSSTTLLIPSIYQYNLLTADTSTYVKTDTADFMTS